MYREFSAARARAKDEHVKSVVQAWTHVCMWAKVRSGKSQVKLDDFLPKAPQTLSDHRAALYQLAAKHGGKVVEVVH